MAPSQNVWQLHYSNENCRKLLKKKKNIWNSHMCPDNWIHLTRSSHGDGCLRCHSFWRRGCEMVWEMSGDRLETGASLSACKQPEHKWSSGRGNVLKRDPIWIRRPPSNFFFFKRRVWNRWQKRSHDGEGQRVPSVRSQWLLKTFYGTDKTHKD